MGGLWKGDLGAVGSQGPLSPPRGAPPPHRKSSQLWGQRARAGGRGRGVGVLGSAASLGSLHRSCQESLGYDLPDQTQAPVQREDETQLDSASYSSPGSPAGKDIPRLVG